MVNGSKPVDGGHLTLTTEEKDAIAKVDARAATYIRPYMGTEEFIDGRQRYCLWIRDERLRMTAIGNPLLEERFDGVAVMRGRARSRSTAQGVATPYAFQQVRQDG